MRVPPEENRKINGKFDPTPQFLPLTLFICGHIGVIIHNLHWYRWLGFFEIFPQVIRVVGDVWAIHKALSVTERGNESSFLKLILLIRNKNFNTNFSAGITSLRQLQ
jgi:hypothetical protein